MSADHRAELQTALTRYTSDTLACIQTVGTFCQISSKWVLYRETEVDMMMDINDRVDRPDLGISHVGKSLDKKKAIGEYVASKMSKDQQREELEKELAEVLSGTAEGLENLQRFLDAVEMLAVTSWHVFIENQLLCLPEDICLESVQNAIVAARLVCPILLEFKRDTKVFFLPKIQNVQVLAHQLDRYIQTVKKIIERMEKSCLDDFGLKVEPVVDLDVGLSDADIRRMLDHVNQLEEVRSNEAFRMAFMFQEKLGLAFIKEFSKRHPQMSKFLQELEETAVQLDNMNKGAKISSVAGSSVGAVGGVLSIIGLALIPVTAGVSLALTMTGIGLGITSGVNSLVTAATEVGVNATQRKKASAVFESFMKDVQSIQAQLEQATHQTLPKLEASQIEVAVGVGKLLWKTGTVGKNIDGLVDAVSAVKMLKNEELMVGAGKVVAQEGKALRNVPRVAQDIPDIGQAVAKAPLALTKTARAGFIALNALFLGMDIYFICKDSISLAKGNETQVSQFIRARATLWSSEMNSWKKIHDSLEAGLPSSEKNEIILETPFYVQMEVKK
ncbi:uncharacterized protein apol [Pholidichthys leucotaenia]